MTQFVEQLRNQAKWYAQPGHNARDLMDSHLLEKAADEIERLRIENDALRAKIEQSVPDGWKLVPIEPTTGMICEMERQWMCGSQIDMAKREWKAACAAAPSQEKTNGSI